MIEIIEHGTNYKSTKLECIKDGVSRTIKTIIKYEYLSSNHRGKRAFYMCDIKGHPILDPIRFISSDEMLGTADSSKRIMLVHLVGLYNFLSAFETTIQELINDRKLIILFIHFLCKMDYISDSEQIYMKFLKPLSVDSMNKYLNTVKSYFRWLGTNENAEIFNPVYMKIIRGKKSLSSIKAKGLYSPEGIIETELLSKLFIYSKEKDFTLYLGERILFETGMRVGTMLGITEEDIYYDVDKNGNILHYFIRVRNRFSDKEFQSVKNLPNVISSDFKPNFRTEKESINYHTYTISYSLYKELKKKIALNYKLSLTTKFCKDNYNKAKADRYLPFVPISHSKNRYVFLNKHCSVMTENNWNDRYLKPALDAVGISHDKSIKKNGLNHLFRHTAFSLLISKGYLRDDAEKLAFLKNSTPSTILTYFNPNKATIDKVVQIQENLFDNLIEGNTNLNEIKTIQEDNEAYGLAMVGDLDD